MTELVNSLQTFTENVRIVDFFDVAIISLLLYMLLNWFRESASRRTITNLLMLLAVYLMARFTEMYLTEIFIEGLFIFILIGLVVVFQSDIRRVMDQLGRWRFGNSNQLQSEEEQQVTSIIAEAASQMAKSRTGALIVLKGTEELERHINGGTEIKGKVTLPLLQSIFNPTAPGHDGAVLVEDDQITSFGVHLPLSKRLDKISQGGTRHAAALGLSEHCDALVVIVSEERGVISVAQGGHLQQLESADQLKTRLQQFEEKHYAAQSTSWTYRLRHIYWRSASAAVGLSVLLWFAIAYNADTIYRTYDVPIEYRNLNASNIVMADSMPIEARVTLYGPEQAFQLLETSQLAVSFNLDSNSLSADSLLITQDNIELPSDLNLYSVSPRSLDIGQWTYNRAMLPVKLATKGTLPAGFRLLSIDAEPDSIPIQFTSQLTIDSLTIDAIDLSTVTGSTTFTRPLQLPENSVLPNNVDGQIKVTLSVIQDDD